MQIIHMLLLDRLMSIMYRLALVLSIMHLIMCKGRCKTILMLQILMILATYNICIQTLMHRQPRKSICRWTTWWVWLINLKHLMLEFRIAYKKVFHLFIHRQLICNMWIQSCRWMGELAMLLLSIRPHSQPSYATPHVSKFSAPYATVDVHNSAPHLHGHSQISEKITWTHVPSSNTVAYNACSSQFKNFGNTHESLPK